jgi:SAM-dependent methyltransferase
MLLLSQELFGGRKIILPEFPRLPGISGLGLSDQPVYAHQLEKKFSYVNTFLEREPVFDLSNAHREEHGRYDFILASDVLEHVRPPLESSLKEVYDLLKPGGLFCITVHCPAQGNTVEHFDGLQEFRVIPLGTSFVLVNRRGDGTIEVREDIVLHSGSGSTIEMREFSRFGLAESLRAAGFTAVRFLEEDVPEFGIIMTRQTSQPLIAVKGARNYDRRVISDLAGAYHEELLWKFHFEEKANQAALHGASVTALLEEARQRADAAETELATASGRLAAVKRSKWLKLGNVLGLGPRLDGG